jgi:hypothetical protein
MVPTTQPSYHLGFHYKNHKFRPHSSPAELECVHLTSLWQSCAHWSWRHTNLYSSFFHLILVYLLDYIPFVSSKPLFLINPLCSYIFSALEMYERMCQSSYHHGILWRVDYKKPMRTWHKHSHVWVWLSPQLQKGASTTVSNNLQAGIGTAPRCRRGWGQNAAQLLFLKCLHPKSSDCRFPLFSDF